MSEDGFRKRDNSMTSSVNFEIGVAGTGQPSIKYPQLTFNPDAFFLLGSPVCKESFKSIFMFFLRYFYIKF